MHAAIEAKSRSKALLEGAGCAGLTPERLRSKSTASTPENPSRSLVATTTSRQIRPIDNGVFDKEGYFTLRAGLKSAVINRINDLYD